MEIRSYAEFVSWCDEHGVPRSRGYLAYRKGWRRLWFDWDEADASIGVEHEGSHYGDARALNPEFTAT